MWNTCRQSFCTSISPYSENRTKNVTQHYSTQHKGSACLNWIPSLLSVGFDADSLWHQTEWRMIGYIYVSSSKFWFLHLNCLLCCLLLLTENPIWLVEFEFLVARNDELPLTEAIACHSTQISCCSLAVACDNTHSKHIVWDTDSPYYLFTKRHQYLTRNKYETWKATTKKTILMFWPLCIQNKESKIWRWLKWFVSNPLLLLLSSTFWKALSIIHQKGKGR